MEKKNLILGSGAAVVVLFLVVTAFVGRGKTAPSECLKDKKIQDRIISHLKFQYPQLEQIEMKILGEETADVKGLLKIAISLKRPQDGAEQKQYAYLASDCSSVLVSPAVLDLKLDVEQLKAKREEESKKIAEEDKKKIQGALAKVGFAGVPMKGNLNAPVTILEYSDFQ